MRRVPVLTLASLVAVFALIAAPVNAATLFGTDTPDVRLAPGAAGDSVFDLNDFFDSSTSASIGYTASGASVDADGVVTVPGASDEGSSAASFTATADGESVTVDSVVKVTNGIISNVPGIDNNNRIAGLDGGNAFLNGIVPGSSVSSNEALQLVGGSSMSDAGATGSAALLATIGEVSVSQTNSGLYVRTASVDQTGVGTASAGGLTATINEDGTYSLAADADFAGPLVVSLGNDADAVHVLAAKATSVEIADGAFTTMAPSNFEMGTVAYANGEVTVTAAAGQGVLFVANAGVAVGADATVSMNYNSSAAGASIAVVGFDTGSIATLGADMNKIAYELITGANFIEPGMVKNVAATMQIRSGNVLPAFQVVNPTDADLTVTISNLQIIEVGPLANYALIANAKADVAGGDLTDASALPSVNDAGTGAASTDNHFDSPAGAGCLQLDGSAAVVNSLLQASGVDDGLYTAECWVKKVAGDGVFYLHVTDGAKETRAQVVSADLGADWEKVTATGLAKAGGLFVVVQANGGSFLVDDISVRLLKDTDNLYDSALLGM